MTYSGTPRPCSAESSCRRSSSPAGADRGGGLDERVEEPVDDVGPEASKPPLRWTAPITASTVSERIEALSRPPVDSSPRPSLTWSPRPMPRPTSARRAGVDDRRAQLGQPALGQVGVGAVEGLGHDDAEHRVAEELQALVGRQAAVLVGVGTVGEGALEQLGVQVGSPSARGARRSWSVDRGRVRGPGDGRTGRRTGRTSPHARCGRCFAPQAGLAQVTRVGATAFHCERR